jgi:hypothetical protein
VNTEQWTLVGTWFLSGALVWNGMIPLFFLCRKRRERVCVCACDGSFVGVVVVRVPVFIHPVNEWKEGKESKSV